MDIVQFKQSLSLSHANHMFRERNQLAEEGANEDYPPLNLIVFVIRPLALADLLGVLYFRV